jgi:hypothetical protein
MRYRSSLLSLFVCLVVWTAGMPSAAADHAGVAELTDDRAGRAALSELRVVNRPHSARTGEFPHDVERWRPFVEIEFSADWADWALRIIACESRGDPDAKNRRSSAAGLFQFLRDTWDWVSESTGAPSYADGGPYHSLWNIRNAAWLLEHGGRSHWQCKARR